MMLHEAQYTAPPISTLQFRGFCQCLPWWTKIFPWLFVTVGTFLLCVHTINAGLQMKSIVSKKW